MNPMNENMMTIFPELANPQHSPRVMRIFPYLSDSQIKIRVLEIVSCMFEDKMGERFTQSKLKRFLIDNQNNLYNMVEELMTEYDVEIEDVEDDEDIEEEVDLLLCEAILDVVSDFINIRDWIDAQARP